MTDRDDADRQELQSNLELLLTADANVATGNFNHLGWNLQAGGGDASWTSRIGSVHETCHFELNQSTAFGAFLMAQAYLTRELGTPTQMLKLQGLADRCQNCHEIFATLQSLLISEDNDISRAAFVDAYPDYVDWLWQGEKLIEGLSGKFTRIAHVGH